MDIDRFSTGKSVMAVSYQNIATATDTVGEWINTQYYKSLVASIHAAITTGAISAIAWDEADEDDQSDAAAMNDSFNLYQPDIFPISGDATEHDIRIGCISKKKWVRLRITTTGTVDIDVYAMAELNEATSRPPETNSSVVSAT